MQCSSSAGIFAGIQNEKPLEPAPVLDVWRTPFPPVDPNIGQLKSTIVPKSGAESTP